VQLLPFHGKRIVLRTYGGTASSTGSTEKRARESYCLSSCLKYQVSVALSLSSCLYTFASALLLLVLDESSPVHLSDGEYCRLQPFK